MKQQDREYVAIVASLFAAYPQTDRNADTTTGVIWAHQLCDIDADVLRRAVTKLANTEAYMPPISRIREECERIVRGELEIICGSCGAEISEYERADEETTHYDGEAWHHYNCAPFDKPKRQWFAGQAVDRLRVPCQVCKSRFEFMRPVQLPAAVANLTPNICDPCAKTWRRPA